MRTTIDLPDDLLRRTKAVAALRGLKLKDYFRLLVERDINREVEVKPEKKGHDFPIPVVISEDEFTVTFSTNAEISDIFDREDLLRNG